MRNKLSVYAQREIMSRSIDLRIVSEQTNGKRGIARPLVFDVVDDGAYLDPAIRLPYESAQQLMDELWLVGVRPTEGTGSAGSLAATERHLSDMQEIAKHLLKING